MVLSDVEIREAILKKEIQISGEETYIGPSSVDLHLDNNAMILDDKKFLERESMDFRAKEKSAEKFTEYKDWDNLTIHPGEFYILSTKEKITLANDIVGFIQGRSSVARMGIQVHCAGFFDCGWDGTATLEVTNLTKFPIIIPAGTRICQMVFMRTGKPAEIPYGMKKDNKYQGQSGPTITSIHEDFTPQNKLL